MKRLLFLLTTMVILFATSSAFADAGSDQYCDPFLGCATPRGPVHKTPKPAQRTQAKKIKSLTGTNSSTQSGMNNKAQAQQAFRSQLFIALVRKQLSQKPVARSSQDAARVLDAAGLSSLAWAIA